jgi:uncharacterized membrane protein
MSKFVVAVFPDEAKAYEGTRALRELHGEGSVSVYGTVVVARGADGKLAIKERRDQGPVGLGIGALLGGLVGMLGGPAGVIAGAAGGGLVGGWRDYLEAGVSDEFLEVVGRELTPGKVAIVAEVSEEWTAPLDTRMEALGARVVREWRSDVAAELFERRAKAQRAEFDQRKAELSKKASEVGSRMSASIDDAQVRLQRAAESARKTLDDSKQEMGAKLQALEEQASKAAADVKGRIQQRISEIRREFGEREKKLRRAWNLARVALQE